MRVIATAGHVDHGKSTLVRALTGMDPDRWAEEHRRGLTLDLGFAWAELDGADYAFVDVPGHQRFVANMLAGAGPVPAALFVVAADEGWMPQSEEHLAALDAFGVRHGVLAVSKADRADPGPALADARARIARSTLGEVASVAVSATTATGIAELRGELTGLGARLPTPSADADVRLWVDRSFTVRGAGTVVTGTLAAGSLRTGDELELADTGERVRVRGLQSLGRDVGAVSGVARVALNLRGVDHERLRRGDALLTPGVWRRSEAADVRLRGIDSADAHREAVLHLGAAATPVRVRALGADTARLTLTEPLPLRAGDHGVLRDPGQHRVAGVEVLDPAPPRLRRRGSATARARELAAGEVALGHLRRGRFVAESELRALGLTLAGKRIAGWVVDEQHWADLPRTAMAEFDTWTRANPLAAGMPVGMLRERLGLPAELLGDLLRATELRSSDGLIRRGDEHVLPQRVERAVREVLAGLESAPFRAPEADELTALGLGQRELAAAGRAGRLLRMSGGIVLAPDALTHAADLLANLDEPFTVSQARKTLGTTRRVAIPLLERLDAEGITEPADSNTRRIRR